jgi:hypothetical protein
VPNYSIPQRSTSDLRVNRTPSFGSGSTSTPNKLRKSLRNLKISGPIMGDDNEDGARTPLSPRFYTDPGIPPEPPTAKTNESMSPVWPNTNTPRWQPPNEEEIDQIRDLPSANPQRMGFYDYSNQAQTLTDNASTRPDPTKVAPAAGSTGTLPLREMNRAHHQQQLSSQSAFPLSPGQWNSTTSPTSAGGMRYVTSAGPVKTTFLESRRDRLGGGIRTGQATPYSPYMPFTPVTPVTPHLTSRAERRQREKEERKTRGVLTEEEAVVDEKELWSSGY